MAAILYRPQSVNTYNRIILSNRILLKFTHNMYMCVYICVFVLPCIINHRFRKCAIWPLTIHAMAQCLDQQSQSTTGVCVWLIAQFNLARPECLHNGILVGYLTHWGWNKNYCHSADDSTRFISLRLKLHWNLFPSTQLTMIQHWCRYRLVNRQTTSHYPNRLWRNLWRIYVSVDLDAFIPSQTRWSWPG